MRCCRKPHRTCSLFVWKQDCQHSYICLFRFLSSSTGKHLVSTHFYIEIYEKKREYNDLQIWYCMSVILCAENVNNTTPRALADYLTANTKYKWSQLEVVFLYSSMQSQHPLCAAVRMPNVLYAACWEKNNTWVGLSWVKSNKCKETVVL